MLTAAGAMLPNPGQTAGAPRPQPARVEASALRQARPLGDHDHQPRPRKAPVHSMR
jgi:hypothetical protein